MRRCAALLAVVLAVPAPALGQQASEPEPQPAGPARTASQPKDAAPKAARPAAARPAAGTDADDLTHIKRGLASPTTLRDAAASAPAPTFRVSVSEKVDIWKFWGDSADVAAMVRPNGGTWHQEFQNMVTPDEFKGYGGVFTNAEKLQLAASSLAFAGAMQLLGAGVRQAKQAIDDRARRKAKEEVQSALEEFYQQHPEARPAATPLTTSESSAPVP